MSIRKNTREAVRSSRKKALEWLRNSFFTGIVVGAPIGITIWLVWSFVSFVDKQIKPLIPHQWNPETYTKFALPGFGILVAVVGLTLLGALAANLIGRSLLRLGERLVARVPLVRSIYTILKQVIGSFAPGESSAFKEAVLIEYPRAGVWAVAFVTNRAPGGEIPAKVPGAIAVFVPTAPNPATGFLVYVTPDKVKRLDMPVDKAAQLLLSVGILSPDQAGAASITPLVTPPTEP